MPAVSRAAQKLSELSLLLSLTRWAAAGVFLAEIVDCWPRGSRGTDLGCLEEQIMH